ncbi:thioredoxin domain-containing protein [Bifidobacterium hapali]|uniref:Thioredoxin domain-containing protein n=1 Tax=Bifidobacterium hapali TaxID=1630172 RepID=A0A261FZ02_9BIFI|nr:tetratricopeptide repeat protein [Bifidobacterium hapali]OZG63986.1 thioredoxin domain-containing protein [Bifidobacterium hapali]
MVDQYDSWLVGQGNNNQSGDLNELKHQVKAAPGELGGAPAAGGYVIDVTESTFQATVTTSATFPILLLLWTANDDRLFDMARALGDAVNKLNGQIQLARIDVKENPQIAQAFRVTAVPALFALVNGQPMMVTQPGVPTDDELTQITDAVLPQIIQLAQQQGVTGTAPYSGDPEADRKAAQEQAEQIPPEHEEAHRLALSGDYSGAAAAYEKVLEANPNDTLAARERSKALLLARSATADVREVRAAAAAHPDDVDAQLAVADIDMIGGQIQDAFDRLLDWLAAGHKDELEPVRKRLLEYFAIPEPTDERLKRARRRLATLMF